MSRKKVNTPDAAFNFIPFTIQQNGRVFRPSPSFNLQKYADITVFKTYYVDKSTGSDINTGSSWEQAFRTLKTAWGRPDVDRVYVRNSRFHYSELLPLPTRNIEVIATDDNVYLQSTLNDKASAFARVDNHYEATFSGSSFVGNVYDMSNPSTISPLYWAGTPLIAKQSIAEVDATPNSYYYIYGTTSYMYIHLFDERAPDANMLYNGAYSFPLQADNLTVYFYGVKIWATRIRNNTAAGGLKAYFENCLLSIFETVGADVFLQKCILYTYGDSHNIDARNGVLSHVIEIDCEMRNLSNSTTEQSSTAHNGCIVVRINGDYHDVGGQVIADVNGCKTWCLGSKVHDSRSGVGFYFSGEAWLDSCHSYNNFLYDLQSTSGAIIYLRNCIMERGAVIDNRLLNGGTILYDNSEAA